MKFITLIFIVSIARVAHSESECRPETVQWKQVENHEYDWDGDGKSDKLIAEVAQNPECEGLGVPARLRVLLSGRQPFQDIWPDGGLNEKNFDTKDNRNELRSNRMVLIQMSAKSREAPLLFITPDGSSSAPVWHRVYGLRKGSVKLLFHDLDLKEIQDVDRDGILDLIGQQDVTESCSKDYVYSDYVPTLVYRYRPGKEPPFVINEKATVKENKRLGYPWAGAKGLPSKQVLVFKDPQTGKRRLVWREEADKLGLKGLCYSE